jgi:nucleotide-binding universal stress UspA family protein
VKLTKTLVEGDEMKEINRVMACIDMSDYSEMTVGHALAIVRGLQSEVLLFNVINSRDIEYLNTASEHYSGKFDVEKYIERVKAERYQAIQEMIEKQVDADKAKMRILIDVGIPIDAILKAIETEKIDLVVIASKGRSNLLGTLFGSNAERVFRHSPVPVLSIRSRERFSRNR